MPDAPAETFRILRNRVLALFVAGRHAAALDEARALRRRFPDRGEIPFWIACALCEQGYPEEALATLRQASDDGLWWPADWLRDDDDLAALRGSDGLEAVVAASERLQAECVRGRAPETVVLLPHAAQDVAVVRTRAQWPPESEAAAHGRRVGTTTGRPSPGLLVALHGWGELAEEFVEPWRAGAQAGLLVAVPESSQEPTPRFFVWDDRERARDDVARALSSLRRTWHVDEERSLYAGFSQGGGLAVSWALTEGPLEARAFLAFAAGLSDVAPEALRSLDQATARGVRGRLVVGDADEALDDARDLHETLRAGGVPCTLDIVPGLDHDLPGDIDERLTYALRLLFAPA